MNTPKDNGGQAFPGEQDRCPNGTWNQTWDPGMTLRDWFAGQALAGSLANGYIRSTQEHVERAWELADAMLAFK